MNTHQINKVLTKYLNFFQGVHPLDLLPSTLIKPAIIVINLDKYYMPSSHWVAVVSGEVYSGGGKDFLKNKITHSTSPVT